MTGSLNINVNHDGYFWIKYALPWTNFLPNGRHLSRLEIHDDDDVEDDGDDVKDDERTTTRGSRQSRMGMKEHNKSSLVEVQFGRGVEWWLFMKL